MGPQKVLTFNEVTKDVEDGKWVVLSADKQSILCEGNFLAEVLEEAVEKGQPNPEAYRIRRFQEKRPAIQRVW